MVERGWKYYPALKLLIPYAAGILLARLAAPSLPGLLLLLLLSCGWLVVAMRRGRILLAPPLILAVAAAGALWYELRSAAPSDGGEGGRIAGAEIVGRVAGEPVFRADRVEFTAECDSILYRNSAAHPAGRVLVRLYDRSPFDPALLPRPGDRITAAGTAILPAGPANPGEFDYGAYLRSRGIVLVMSVNRASMIHRFGRDDLGMVERVAEPIRREARAFCDRHVGGEEGDILRALLLGEREYIDPETRQAFTRTGTVHVLAVSGFNVGIIALAVFVAVSWIRSRRWQLLLFIPPLVLYAVVAGAEASILRATIMACAFMVARTAGRITRPLNTLGLAALLILLLDPEQLFDIGFQLSFASVAGIIMGYVPAWEWILSHAGMLRKIAPLRWIAEMFLLTLSAQLFTLPFVLYHFGFISFISLLINIPVVPLTSLALGAGAAGTLAGLVWDRPAGWFGGSAHLALGATEWLVERGAELPGTGAEIVTVGAAGALLLAAVLLWLGLSDRPARVLLRSVAFGAALAAVVLSDRALDPLRRADGVYLCLLKAKEGTLAAVVRGDSVTLYAAGAAADSTALRYSGDALRRRFGAATVDPIPLDSAGPRIARHDLLLIGDRPREVAITYPPVILSNTALRPLGMVSAAGDPFLQVPLRAELEEAIVLRYDGRWHEVRWR